RTNEFRLAIGAPAATSDQVQSPFAHTPAPPARTPGEITFSPSTDNSPPNPARGQTFSRTPAGHAHNLLSGYSTGREYTTHPHWPANTRSGLSQDTEWHPPACRSGKKKARPTA